MNISGTNMINLGEGVGAQFCNISQWSDTGPHGPLVSVMSKMQCTSRKCPKFLVQQYNIRAVTILNHFVPELKIQNHKTIGKCNIIPSA